MDLQKINVKFYFANAGTIRLGDFIDIFNSWIQASDGIFYDLADYSHVPNGPGILLIAHEANLSIDNTDGRLGLLYNHKQPLKGSNGDRLRTVLAPALEYCRKVEEEPVLGGRTQFLGNETMLMVNDRLAAPNSVDTFAALKDDLEDFAGKLFLGGEFSLEPRSRDGRRRFTVDLKTRSPLDISALCKNLERAVA